MSAYADAVVAAGAFHYWRLDETSGTTATDSVGGTHGTITGVGAGVTLGVAGVAESSALTMSGAGGAVNRIITLAMPLPAPPFTIEAWYRTTGSATAGLDPLVGTHLANPRYFVNLYQVAAQQKLRLEGYNAAGTRSLSLTTRKTWDGRWHHMVWIVGTTSWTCYIDGTFEPLAVQIPFAPSSAMAAQPLYLGSMSDGRSWTGGLDEVALYAYPLPPAEIAYHYALGMPGGFITLEQATDHLRFAVERGSTRERDLLLKMAHAEAIVLDYINTTAFWRDQLATWTRADPPPEGQVTVPGVVQAAILLQLGELMRFRGDDVEGQGAPPGEGYLAPHIRNLLMRSRDPVIA